VFKRGFKSWCERLSVDKRAELGLRSDDPLAPRTLAQKMSVLIWQPTDVPGLAVGALKTLLKDDPDGWSAVTLRLGSSDLIILNSAHSPARQTSDLMHELAHMILGHRPSRVDVTDELHLLLRTHDAAQEEEAAWLAACLLLPRPALLGIRRRGESHQSAAKRYGVSSDMLTYRIRVSGVEIQAKRARSLTGR
jgi:Zn-dependent peptidase ImmA (M78 family)